jgi:diguanylate cyclase (GGDEF)-like protein
VGSGAGIHGRDPGGGASAPAGEAPEDGPPGSGEEASDTPDRRLLLGVLEIAAATAAVEDLDGVLETIAGALGRLFPVDGAALGLVDGDQIVVREILRAGRPARRDPERLEGDGSHLLSWVLKSGRPLWRNDVTTELRFAESLPGRQSGSDMVIPLKVRGELMGALRVSCVRRHAFEPEDFDVLQRCSDVLSVAVETQRLLLHTRRMAETDGVTGVFNHRYFIAALRQEIERARRLERPMALLMADIDHFKRFNDSYGHQAGDEVLRQVAQCLSRTLRRSDVVCRYGGEEFAAILQDVDLGIALEVADKVRAEVERGRFQVSAMPRPLEVTVSLGVSAYPEDARTPAELVACADQGLYQAKRGGRNRVAHRRLEDRPAAGR